MLQKKKSLIICLLKTMIKSPPSSAFVFKTSKMSDFFGWFFPQFNKKYSSFLGFWRQFWFGRPPPHPLSWEDKKWAIFFLLQASLRLKIYLKFLTIPNLGMLAKKNRSFFVFSQDRGWGGQIKIVFKIPKMSDFFLI